MLKKFEPEFRRHVRTLPAAASSVEAETTLDISDAVGTGLAYAREDHTHGSPDGGWDDIRVDATVAKPGASSPDWDTFQGTTKIWWFDPGTDQEIHFAVQFPHSWDGAAISPHVHWVPKTNSDGDPAAQKVRWGLEYSFANPGTVFGATTTIYAVAHVPDEELVAFKHYKTYFADITPSAAQDDISSMMICRLFRDANDAADTYEDDAGLLEFDIHFHRARIGSANRTTI